MTDCFFVSAHVFTLRQYLLTLADTRGLTRTLGEIDVCRDERGAMCCTVGNSAAVFRIRHEGRIRALRCYTRPADHRAEIYGDRLLRRELFLYTSPASGEWVDVVLDDWIEGETLSHCIREAVGRRDTTRLAALAAAFDRLAADLVADDRAHGDLKPENIVVGADGQLHLIDFDAAFLPSFAGQRSPELGTAAWQHPARDTDYFDATLDDYPAALISTTLHALALDPSLHERHPHPDGQLFDPLRIGSDPALREVLALFERTGDALRYRIARLLTSPVPQLPALKGLLAGAIRGQAAPVPNGGSAPEAPPELFVENGLWGFRTAQRVVIPPLYDSGFDFSEGLAAVRLGTTWHFIDPEGRTRLSLPECDAVKPFRNGVALTIRRGIRTFIDRTGRPVRATTSPDSRTHAAEADNSRHGTGESGR